MVQIIEIKDNPFWEHDVDEAIHDFEAEFGVEPHMFIGKNFIDLTTINSYNWINYESISNSNYRMAKYKGISCEYDPDISCVILQA